MSRIVVDVVADEIAIGVGTASEMVVNEFFGDADHEDHIETIGEGFSDSITDPTIDSAAEIVIEVTGGTGYEALDEIIVESFSGIISWAISHQDRWSLDPLFNTPSSPILPRYGDVPLE